MEYIIKFNNKQFIKLVIHDVSQETFKRRGGGRWGYYISAYPRNDRRGLFGEIHLVKKGAREDTVAHELIHFLSDYLTTRGSSLNSYTEERIAELFDGLTRKIIKILRKEGIL